MTKKQIAKLKEIAKILKETKDTIDKLANQVEQTLPEDSDEPAPVNEPDSVGEPIPASDPGSFGEPDPFSKPDDTDDGDDDSLGGEYSPFSEPDDTDVGTDDLIGNEQDTLDAEIEEFWQQFSPDIFDDGDVGNDPDYEKDEVDIWVEEQTKDLPDDYYDAEKGLINRTLNDYIQNKYKGNRAAMRRRTIYAKLSIINVVTFAIETLAKQMCPEDTGSLKRSIYSGIDVVNQVGYVVAGVGLYIKGDVIRGPVNYATYVHEGTKRMGARKFLAGAAEHVAYSLSAGFENWGVRIRLVYDLECSPSSKVIVAFVHFANSGVEIDAGYDIGVDSVVDWQP